MLVRMGNAAPHQCYIDAATGAHDHGPIVAIEPGVPAEYKWAVSDSDGYDFDVPVDEHDPGAFALHLLVNPQLSRMPGYEAAISIMRDWQHHSTQPPSWVESDNPSLQAFLAGVFGCPEGAPEDVEDTHHTMFGPPGVGPQPGANPDDDVEAAK